MNKMTTMDFAVIFILVIVVGIPIIFFNDWKEYREQKLVDKIKDMKIIREIESNVSEIKFGSIKTLRDRLDNLEQINRRTIHGEVACLPYNSCTYFYKNNKEFFIDKLHLNEFVIEQSKQDGLIDVIDKEEKDGITITNNYLVDLEHLSFVKLDCSNNEEE